MAEKKPNPKTVAKSIERMRESVDTDGVVEEVPEVVAIEEVAEEVVEVVDVPEVVEVVAEPATKTAPPTVYAVVGGGTVDHVQLSKCVFKSTVHKRSLTIHHLQRRLTEWGYKDAYLDKDGYFGDLTLKSVTEFRADHNIQADSPMDAETFSAIFEGDTNVAVVID